MRTVDKYLWKIRWAGTRAHFTEAEIRREHPEAVHTEGSRIVVEMPDTEEERRAAQPPRGGR